MTTALDFISPDRSKTDGGFAPILKSPMERAQRDAGAVYDERDGWRVPVSFPDEARRLQSVGIVDLTHLGKLEVRGVNEKPDAREILTWHQVRPGIGLALCEYRDAFVLRSSLARRAKVVLDQTGTYAILGLVGPRAGEALRRLTHLHELPASGPVAHVAAHVLEREGAYWIVFGQEYGHYLWEVAVDAAEHLGGGPVGIDAIGRTR
jgi:glycine cleavage system aminomethyltransferase T